MALRKHIQMRKNQISLSVFQAEGDGQVLLSIDKDFTSRRIKGPLFKESELEDILWLINDYNEWESKGLHTKHQPAQTATRNLACDVELARAEIRNAIQAIHAQKDTDPNTKGHNLNEAKVLTRRQRIT